MRTTAAALRRPGPREVALLGVRHALERKAYDLVLLDVRQRTSLADYFVICTGRSDRQVQAIADAVEQGLRVVDVRPLAVEGYARGHWILLDYGDVVVHVLLDVVRQHYDLDRLWAGAPRVRLPEPYRSQARDLRLASAQR